MTLVTGTSAQKHGSSELCSILNQAIREDDPNATIHAAVFAYAINMMIVAGDHTPAAWLLKLFPKSYPCVHCVSVADRKSRREVYHQRSESSDKQHLWTCAQIP